MKKFALSLFLMAGAALVSAQSLPDFILPEDNYSSINESSMEAFQVLGREMAAGKDPSFASVSAIFPHYMDYPKALVGIKEHHGRFLTSWDGSIIFPPFYLSLEVWEDSVHGQMKVGPVSLGSSEVERLGECLEGDWLPVVTRKFSYHKVQYDQTVMAISKNFDTDMPLIAWVRMRVTNHAKGVKNQELSIRFQGTGSRPSTQIWATSGRMIVNCPMLLRQEDFKIVNENGDPVLWSSRADGKFGENRLTFSLTLKPEEEQCIYLCIPFEPVREREAKPIAEGDFDKTYETIKGYWEGIMDRGMQINVPEEIVNNAYRTWLENNFLLVQEDKLRLTYKTTDAPFFYEGIFGYAAAMYLNTITTAGYYEEAKKCARMFLRLQRDDGSISGVNRRNAIIPHQHGGILYAISQIYRMGRDKEWFASVAPALIKGCNWIEEKRSLNKQSRDDVGYGLLPPMRSNVDNVGTETQEYCGNAWCWAGMHEVGLALKEMGGSYASEGNRLLRLAEEYRKDILASMDKATVTGDGFRYIPLDLAFREPIPYAPTNGPSHYYSMISCRMLESMIFDKDDPRMEAYTTYYEHYKGIILGILRTSASNKLGFTAHFSAGYGISNMRMGNLDRSLLNFYGMFSYGQARNLYATQEHDNFGSNNNDPWYQARQPHLHSTSELIRVTNKMLIYEENGGDLCLAFGIPRAWLEDGKTVEVKNSQTCFGPVSYRIDSEVSGGKISISLEKKSSPVKPRSIQVKLRHPEGKPIRKVTVNGRPWKGFDAEVITLPDIQSGSKVVAFFD